jgi:hypothetical protein
MCVGWIRPAQGKEQQPDFVYTITNFQRDNF